MCVRRVLLTLAAACLACLAHLDHFALAQESFPSKPVRFIVTSPPGGANDILNRILGAKFSDVVGQPVLIDNRAGASGFVAAEMVAKSPADGYTLLMGTEATLVVNPLFFPKVPYDTERDFAPVTITAAIQHMLLVNPSVPATSVQELIALARAKPGGLNYASSGNGSAFHLGMEMFKRMAGVNIVHVPFKGSALSVNAMLAGDVQVMLNGVPGAMPYVRAGKLRALAVAGAKRSPLAPDVPTIGETLPGFEFSGWFGVVAPAATPRPAIQTLHEAFARALHSPDTRDRLAALGYDVVASTPEEMASRIRDESRKWVRVIRESGIRPD